MKQIIELIKIKKPVQACTFTRYQEIQRNFKIEKCYNLDIVLGTFSKKISERIENGYSNYHLIQPTLSEHAYFCLGFIPILSSCQFLLQLNFLDQREYWLRKFEIRISKVAKKTRREVYLGDTKIRITEVSFRSGMRDLKRCYANHHLLKIAILFKTFLYQLMQQKAASQFPSSYGNRNFLK